MTLQYFINICPCSYLDIITIILFIVTVILFILSKLKRFAPIAFKLRMTTLLSCVIITSKSTIEGEMSPTYPTLFLLAFFIILLKKYQSEILRQQRYLYLLLFIALSLLTGFHRFCLEWLSAGEYRSYSGIIDRVFNWVDTSGWKTQQAMHIFAKCILDGFIMTSMCFILFLDDILNLKHKNRKMKEAQMKEELSRLQLESLYARINPDFLHKALQGIANLALCDGTATREISLRLSRYFRYCMNKEEQNLVPLEEEIDMTRIFMEFEQLRVKGQLALDVLIPAELNTFRVPRLLMQSLVECGIRKAEEEKVTDVQFTIEACRIATGVILLITDNGQPYPANYVDNERIHQIRKKLDFVLPEAYLLEIQNQPRKEIRLLLKKSDTILV